MLMITSHDTIYVHSRHIGLAILHCSFSRKSPQLKLKRIDPSNKLLFGNWCLEGHALDSRWRSNAFFSELGSGLSVYVYAWKTANFT